MCDILLRGSAVKKWFKNCIYPDFNKECLAFGNVLVEEGKIKKLDCIESFNSESDAQEVINLCKKIISEHLSLEEGNNCNIKILSPGFIDIHMHEENFLSEGAHFVISEMMLRQGVTTCVGGQCGVQNQPLNTFISEINALGGAPTNYMMLTGYNQKRVSLGIGHYSEPTELQLTDLKRQINKEINEGAAGISFGIEYDPGISTEEIIEVINSIENDDILVAAHYREDGNGAIDSIKEMIEIQKNIGNKKFQISHLSSCSAMGSMKESLSLIKRAMEEYPQLDYDTYPYNAFSTQIGSEVFSEGCFEGWGKSYEDILLTDEPYKNIYCDKQIFEICRSKYPEMLAIAFVMNEEEIEEAIINTNGMIASDGIINHGNGHPRAAGTFPRVIRKYVRENKSISLYRAIEKMTIKPANRLNLKKKGRIEEGADADLVIFDYEKIADGATYEDISIPPRGIHEVYISGELALKENKKCNENLGRLILRR